MKKRSSKITHLSPDDQNLWRRVTKTVTPLSNRDKSADRYATSDETVWHDWLSENGLTDQTPALQQFKTPSPEPEKVSKGRVAADPPLPVQKKLRRETFAPSGIREIERPTHRKLAKGRLPIDARLDLHNLNQEQAHRALLSFIGDGHQRGLRHVLVITGKGTSRNSQGVLRTMLPIWVSTPPLNQMVSGLKHASRDHGGEGAWYIRLKRRRGR